MSLLGEQVRAIVERAIVEYLAKNRVLEHIVGIVTSRLPVVFDGKDGKPGAKGDKGDKGDPAVGPDADAVAKLLLPIVSKSLSQDVTTALLSQLSGPVTDKVAKQVLDIAPRLVRDAIDLGEIARSAAALLPPPKDGSPDSGEQIVSKINGLPLTPDQQIDAKHIKNLPKGDAKSTGLHRGGIKLVWNTQLTGTVNGTNAVFTVPASLPSPKDSKFIVAARGVLKDTDSGDFTVSTDNRTITFAAAPPNGSSQPRIILYHGK